MKKMKFMVCLAFGIVFATSNKQTHKKYINDSNIHINVKKLKSANLFKQNINTNNTQYRDGSDLFFSEYAEGSSNNKYMEIYNPTSEAIDLSGYAYPNVSNAPTTPGEYEYWNLFDEGASVAAGDVYVICHGSSDEAILDRSFFNFSISAPIFPIIIPGLAL